MKLHISVRYLKNEKKQKFHWFKRGERKYESD